MSYCIISSRAISPMKRKEWFQPNKGMLTENKTHSPYRDQSLSILVLVWLLWTQAIDLLHFIQSITESVMWSEGMKEISHEPRTSTRPWLVQKSLNFQGDSLEPDSAVNHVWRCSLKAEQKTAFVFFPKQIKKIQADAIQLPLSFLLK